MTHRKGHIFQRPKTGKWYARVDYTDASGKRRELTRTANDEEHANELLAQLVAQAEQLANGSQPSPRTAQQAPELATAHANGEAQPITFRQLADAYSAHKVKPAQYRGGRKIAGMRGVDKVRIRISVLVGYFGDTDISRITPAVVERFKLERLETPTRHNTERAIASVNRELEQLRAILRFARNEGHINASPFERASTPIISKADETKRTRVLSPDEETRLLEACQKPTRAHLYPIVVAALDTGARKGELLALRWSDRDALKNASRFER